MHTFWRKKIFYEKKTLEKSGSEQIHDNSVFKEQQIGNG
jgi:hypothetical protein